MEHHPALLTGGPFGSVGWGALTHAKAPKVQPEVLPAVVAVKLPLLGVGRVERDDGKLVAVQEENVVAELATEVRPHQRHHVFLQGVVNPLNSQWADGVDVVEELAQSS
jgi:hypothetical protein